MQTLEKSLHQIALEPTERTEINLDEDISNTLLRMIHNSLAIKKGRKPNITFDAVGEYANALFEFAAYFEPRIRHRKKHEILPFLGEAYNTVWEYVERNYSHVDRLSRAEYAWGQPFPKTVH